LNFENQHSFINFLHYIFNDIFEHEHLTRNKNIFFDLLAFVNKRHLGPPKSAKTFLVKYIFHQLQLEGKNVFLLVTTRVVL
jgi:hypothetical protein